MNVIVKALEDTGATIVKTLDDGWVIYISAGSKKYCSMKIGSEILILDELQNFDNCLDLENKIIELSIKNANPYINRMKQIGA